MSDLNDAMQAAAAGLRAQSGRIRIVAENLANAQSTGEGPGAEPYRRQVPVFSTYLEKGTGSKLVELSGVAIDPSAFTLKFDPAHPAANEEGYVLFPNVNPLIEMMDMREAQRSYEANLGALDMARSMAAATIRILE